MTTRWTYIDPYVAFNVFNSFLLVLMAIFGGIGRIFGLVIDADVFAYTEEQMLTKFPYYYILIFGIVLVVVILYLPNGLVGLVQKWRKGGVSKQHVNT